MIVTMNRTLLSLIALSTSALGAAEDVLRFTNGDQLHGEYQGIGEDQTVLWTRADLAAQLSLKSKNIRHIVLQGAAPQKNPSLFSYITLTNGDQIPGRVINFDDKTLELDSHAVGKISIPSTAVAGINPNPFGGKLMYVGPFSPDGWEVLSPQEIKVIEEADPFAGAEENKEEPKVEKKEEKKKEEPSWKHAGSSWYHVKGTQPLIRRDCMGESSRLRFRISWRNRLNVNVALHADFMQPPEKKKEEGENNKKAGIVRAPAFGFNGMSNQAQSFGNSLVLNIYQTYFSLSRHGYDANGQPISQRLVHTQSGVQLPNSGDATIEIRSDRSKGLLMIFINDQYAAQWEDLPRLKNDEEEKDKESTDQPLGSGFGLQCTGTSDPLRLSDVVISEWNGIKDSAYSMSHEKRDIILLGNGTDRYSGEVTGIKNNTVTFKNAYSELQIPLSEVSEIVFAKSAKPETKEAAEGTVTARFYPTGKISGLPLTSQRNILQLNHLAAAQLNVDLSTAISLEFNDENPFLETLDEEPNQPLVPEE